MPLLNRKMALYAAVESVYGTAPSLPSNGILVSKPTIKVNNEKVERKFVTPTLSSMAPEIVLNTYTIAFDVEARCGASAGVAPEIGPLLRACGMSQTINAGTSVVYNLSSSTATHESCSLWLYIDGIRHLIKGARGTWKLNAKVGQFGIFSFEMQGLYAGPTDIALPAVTYSGLDPQIVKRGTVSTFGAWTAGAQNVTTVGSSTTVTTTSNAFATVVAGDRLKANNMERTIVTKNSDTEVVVDLAVNWSAGYPFEFAKLYSPIITEFNLDVGNELFRRDSVAATDGVLEIMLGGRAAKGSINPEAPALSEKDFWTEFKNRTPCRLFFGFGYNITDTRIQVNIPAAVYSDVAYGDRGPILTNELPFDCQYVSGDDEVQLVFK